MSDTQANSIFAAHCIQYLVDLGVSHFCISPGSRSTPLVSAVAAHSKAISMVFHDERSAAFFALGLSKSTGRAAALITTSGTAVANAFPAVIEAYQSSVPLLILSADRPTELLFTGANQTIDQPHMFGRYTQFFFDFPCPSQRFSAKSLAGTLSHSIAKAQGSTPGPVHLNFHFREPLIPVSIPPQDFAVVHRSSPPVYQLTEADQNKLKHRIEQSQNGLLILGEISNDKERNAALQITQKLHWPVFADVSSGCRLFNIPNQIFPVDTLLKSSLSIKPDLILHLGKGVTPKVVYSWLQQQECEYVVIHSDSRRYDPAQRCTWRIEAHLFSLLDLDISSTSALLSVLMPIQQKIRHVLDKQHHQLSETTIARQVPSLLRERGQLFISNSMPIRDINRFASDQYNIRTQSNRGASGIDGIVSTAAGWALGSRKTTVLLVGDLAAMHDIGIWFSLIEMNVHLVVIVVNNGGGGIFSFLPISEKQQIFEKYFAASHVHSIAPMIQTLGVATHQPTSLQDFNDTLQRALDEGGLHCIEIHTDRHQNRLEHQALTMAITDICEKENR